MKKETQGKAEQHAGYDVGGYEMEQEINRAFFCEQSNVFGSEWRMLPASSRGFTTARNLRREISGTKLYKFAFAAKFKGKTENTLTAKFIIMPMSRLHHVKTRFFRHEFLSFSCM